MMKALRNFQKNNQGFTLVELMIVVAIIGILAAIAIPQFSAYRQRAFNSSAQSDVRNIKTAQEVLQADHQVYGSSNSGATLPGAGSGTGAAIAGPLAPATMAANGAFLTGLSAANVAVGVGIGVGNNIYLHANTEGAALYGSFVVQARHNNGPRTYGTDSDTTAIYFIDDPGMIGSGALTTVMVVSTVNTDDFGPSGTVAATGLTTDVVTANWTAQ